MHRHYGLGQTYRKLPKPQNTTIINPQNFWTKKFQNTPRHTVSTPPPPYILCPSGRLHSPTCVTPHDVNQTLTYKQQSKTATETISLRTMIKDAIGDLSFVKFNIYHTKLIGHN